MGAKKPSTDALKETYFGKFIGTSSDSMIRLKSETSTNARDAVTFGLRMRPFGGGVVDSADTDSDEVLLTLKRRRFNISWPAWDLSGRS
jgi:hypothetical protein